MRIQQNTAGFFKYALRAMAYHPCSEICCELGDYFSEIQDYEEAIRWYRCAAEETSAILHVRTGGDFRLAGWETVMSVWPRRMQGRQRNSRICPVNTARPRLHGKCRKKTEPGGNSGSYFR